MARIRSIKPELRTSLTAAEWPREVRYFFTLLWGYLDDYGRGVDEPRLIKADCFPLDDDVTARITDEWLTLMGRPAPNREQAPVCRYTVNGRRYLHCVNWSEHQRPSHPTDSRIPPCPHHEPSGTAPEPLRNDSRTTPESLVPEQLVVDVDVDRASSSRSTSPSPADAADGMTPKRAAHDPERFAAFWRIYPRKVAKGNARKAWDKAIRDGTDPAIIIAAAEFFAMERRGQDPTYTKHPATWLNAACWQDEPDPVYIPPPVAAPQRPATSDLRAAQGQEALARLKQRIANGQDPILGALAASTAPQPITLPAAFREIEP